MEGEVLKALLDLRIALGKLQSAMVDVDKAIQRLMLVEVEKLEPKKETGK